jgi:hypothetical protein
VSFIDDYESEIRSLEYETANDLAEILGKKVEYESRLTDPSDPSSDSDKCEVQITFKFENPDEADY